MLNKVILIGKLGKDPEIKTLESGVTMAKFSMATEDYYKDKSGAFQKSTEWHDIVLWRSLAEKAKNLRTGLLIYVEGKLTHRKWTDRDGKDHRSTTIEAEVIRILEKRDHSGNQHTASSDANQKSTDDSFTPNVSGDDLPF